jgi:hypothetical protein
MSAYWIWWIAAEPMHWRSDVRRNPSLKPRASPAALTRHLLGAG